MAGTEHLLSLLRQNSSLVVDEEGPAEGIFSELAGHIADGGSTLNKLEPDCQAALLRAAFDAVHHNRSMDSIVIDGNANWMKHTARVAELLPLSRFIFMVRDPVAIAADLAEETGRMHAPNKLMADNGIIGAPLCHIQAALNGPDAERILLIDKERLFQDPVRVLEVLYRFMRAPSFEHDLRVLEGLVSTPKLLPQVGRRVVSMKQTSKKRRDVSAYVPVWRRTPRTEATLLLAESG